MNETKIQSNSANKKQLLNEKLFFIPQDGLLIIMVTFYFLFGYDNDTKNRKFFWLIAFSVVYNALISLFLPKNEHNSRKVIKFIIFCDIIIASLFIYNLGGINSDLYICFSL